MLREVGILPVIRAPSADAAVAVVEALLEAGLTVAEITMTVPSAVDAIGAVAKRFNALTPSWVSAASPSAANSA